MTRLLDRLLGTWAFTMHHSAMTEPVSGRQEFVQVLDDAFVMMQCTYDHPDFPDALVVLSEERYHYFDVRGITRVFELTTDETGWTIVRISEDDGDLSQRTTTTFTDDDRMSSTGEASRDHGATWEPDFTAEYQRLR